MHHRFGMFGLQAWFRSSAPAHRSKMIRALRKWIVPGRDTVAVIHGMIIRPIGKAQQWRRLAEIQRDVAAMLAEWNATEVLPGLRALRRRVMAESRGVGAGAADLVASLDSAIRSLSMRRYSEPLFPDGFGSYRIDSNDRVVGG